MKKYILIGTILLSMLLFAACGEEKPLADRVIENLEDCMGAREVTEEEYEEIKKRYNLYPMDYRKSLRRENAYLHVKESDLGNVDIDLSYCLNEDVKVNNVIMYKYEDNVDDKYTKMTVFLYEFTEEDDSNLFIQYMTGVWERHYEDVKEDNTSQKIRPKDRKLGKVKGENYVYQVIDYQEGGTTIDSVYCFWRGKQVVEVLFSGHEDNEIYPKYQKFLNKMKFEGLNDIELEYAEPRS